MNNRRKVKMNIAVRKGPKTRVCLSTCPVTRIKRNLRRKKTCRLHRKSPEKYHKMLLLAGRSLLVSDSPEGFFWV
jgi:hypothetical protein